MASIPFRLKRPCFGPAGWRRVACGAYGENLPAAGGGTSSLPTGPNGKTNPITQHPPAMANFPLSILPTPSNQSNIWILFA